MPISTYSPTTLDWTDLSTVGTQVVDIVTAIQACQTAVEATTNGAVTGSHSPSTTAVAAAEALVWAEIQAIEISGPIQLALDNLKAALNVIVVDEYSAPPIT